MDQMTLDAALAGLDAMQLGAGPQLDVLAVSLSSTDAIGHRYGPDSKELHDQVLRVDRMLGAFFDSLYARRDPARVIVTLTADHGVTPLPETHFAGTDPKRGRLDVGPVMTEHLRRLAARGVDSTALDFEYGMLFVDQAKLTRAGLNADSLVRALAVDLRRVPGMLRVDVRADLPALAARGDRIAQRWLHSLPDDLSVPLVATQREGYYWTDFARWRGASSATHGSPHLLDSHVPVVFYGAAFRPGKYGRPARVVDMAPTLARVLGVTPSEPLDGKVLEEGIKTRHGGIAVPASVPRHR
jgi:arylsulfatase A-like enzyme